jgi:hypothetical protein
LLISSIHMGSKFLVRILDLHMAATIN